MRRMIIGVTIAAIALIALAFALGDGDGDGSGALPAGDPVRGQTLFEQRCAACHGTDAEGTTQGPPLVHPFYRPGHHADGAFLIAVRRGVTPHHWNFGPMPAIPDLSEQAIADITRYVRGLQEAAGIR